MREIDDRYPEFAEPYEPVKGGRHHKGLYPVLNGNRRRAVSRLPAFFSAGILLLTGMVLLSGFRGTPPPEPEEPELPIIIAQEPEPDPEMTTEPPGPEPEELLPEEPPPESETVSEATTEEGTEPTTESHTTTTAAAPEETTRVTTRQTTTTRRTTTTKKTTTTTKETTTTTTTEEESYEDPEIKIEHVWYWGDFNTPYGLCHLQVSYTVTANDADEESLVSSGSVSMVTGSTAKVTWDGKTGSGTINADLNTDDTGVFANSGTEWLTEVTLNYTLNGKEKTKKVSEQGRPRSFFLYMDSERVSGEVNDDYMIWPEYRVSINSYEDDPHDFAITFTRVQVVWYDEFHDRVGSARTIWDGSENSPFSGRTVTTADGERNVRYTFKTEDEISVSPPDDTAIYFNLIFYADVKGGDAYDNPVELQSWDSEYIRLPD